jgi:hypothetical protein
MSRAVSRLSNPILRASSSRLAAPSKFLTTSAKKNASDLARLTGRNALLSTPVARVARGASVLGARSASSDEGGSMMVGRVLSYEIFQAKKRRDQYCLRVAGDGGRHWPGLRRITWPGHWDYSSRVSVIRTQGRIRGNEGLGGSKDQRTGLRAIYQGSPLTI